MTIAKQKKPAEQTTRHEEKTTRSRFLQAAEKIFARDGFDASKLEEIAAAAGYTRGAFYANFESKEDLFLALLEQEITARIQKMRSQVGSSSKPEEKLRALRDFWLEMCLDRRWSLLVLEFKLFAVRHPEVKTRLTAMHRKLVSSGVDILQGLMSALGRRNFPAFAVGMAFFALSNGLTVENMLDRTAMPEDSVRKIMVTFFDAMLAE
jgi:AcrR family transcriptional regulator